MKDMERTAWITLLMATACFLLSSWAFADVPHLVRYQGTAVDAKGVPLEGPYALTFRLYDAETAGNLVWQEPQPNVPVSKGHFSVLIGQVNPLNADWSKPLWLSIQVNTDSELAPRQRITSVPLAIRAEKAESLTVPLSTSTITDDANSLVPKGAIILWDGTTCPAGYTRLAAYDDRFLVGSSAAGTPGGSNTHDHGGATGSYTLTVADIPAHTHSTPAHTHTLMQVNNASATTNFASRGGSLGNGNYPQTGNPPGTAEGGGTSGATGGGGGHTHTIAPADSRPAFMTILLCKRN